MTCAGVSRGLNLTKEKSESLASRLQERNLLEKGVKVTLDKKRTEDLLALFTMKDDFCNDITKLLSNWKYHMIKSTDTFS